MVRPIPGNKFPLANLTNVTSSKAQLYPISQNESGHGYRCGLTGDSCSKDDPTVHSSAAFVVMSTGLVSATQRALTLVQVGNISVTESPMDGSGAVHAKNNP
jgi:hypothetical protein